MSVLTFNLSLTQVRLSVICDISTNQSWSYKQRETSRWSQTLRNGLYSEVGDILHPAAQLLNERYFADSFVLYNAQNFLAGNLY